MKPFVKALVAAALISMAGGAAQADEQAAPTQSMKAECYARSNLLYALATEHGEKLDQTRRVGSNGLLEAFKSPTDGTWTIVYSNDDTVSCVLATGDGLETDEDEDQIAANDLTI
jgi:hypothetical protein